MNYSKVFNNWTKKFNYVKSVKVLASPKTDERRLAEKSAAISILRYLSIIA